MQAFLRNNQREKHFLADMLQHTKVLMLTTGPPLQYDQALGFSAVQKYFQTRNILWQNNSYIEYVQHTVHICKKFPRIVKTNKKSLSLSSLSLYTIALQVILFPDGPRQHDEPLAFSPPFATRRYFPGGFLFIYMLTFWFLIGRKCWPTIFRYVL